MGPALFVRVMVVSRWLFILLSTGRFIYIMSYVSGASRTRNSARVLDLSTCWR
ncbi:hypothetical protein EJ03DRAFT_332576 [Teratosphaeria nubilosa]|uniref:Uncharacterized protein n=1 Tax=Teratosphaeria nubilosa TaxID=161662 RepID=A0A6G1KTB1_9PEZI|nr:hypothetical protein EJ03DRAFT_332576 [Teratosphaeria nubilosa]